MSGPAATIGSMHVCPMLTPGLPPIPHVGGPVLGPGEPTVLIEGKTAAVVGDMCTCIGPPDVIATGESTVIIGGKSAATVNSMMAHGGVITSGAKTVLIGTGTRTRTAVMPIEEIPIPEVKPVLRALSALANRKKQLKEAIAKQKAVKEKAVSTEGEPSVYNHQWRKEKTVVREHKVLKVVTLTADVMNIPDGEKATIKVLNPEIKEDGENQVVELEGIVKNKQVTVEWELEDASANERSNG